MEAIVRKSVEVNDGKKGNAAGVINSINGGDREARPNGEEEESPGPPAQETQEPQSKKERRVVSKVEAEERKKKRKKHYSLQQELARLWEKMRRRNIEKGERSNAVFIAATKKQLEGFISSLHGQVAALLRHMVGSVVVEHAFQLGNGSQKQRLLSELYSTELQLFKDLTSNNEGSALMEYFSIADKPGKFGSGLLRSEERKKIIKGMKGHVRKIACDQYGCLVLVSILSVVDDTKLIKKVIIHELEPILKDLVFDKGEGSADEEQTRASAIDESDHGDAKADTDLSLIDVDNGVNSGKNLKFIDGGKKDPSIRRSELFVESGLAERLIDTCIESVGELLKSNFGKEVIYEVATGGSDAVLQCSSAEKIEELHRAIASLAALPKTEELQDHILEHFHSSRTIRKLVLECPKFASTLWKSALTGKCEMWAQGHSCKIVSAFLESSHDEVRHLAEKELQPLVKRGVLRNPQ
ncbi:hypothetical protein QJS04_geneDACA007172 [Acorus gramineus]|uniref:CPL domain-containing protein n=1 Tax=Acorus gramineus TaxID=55184 RepID=A0AAV9BKT0_ACOGR|nr:hypothetical protein QJS04_geneDACA007172 [Acorus gramineus]